MFVNRVSFSEAYYLFTGPHAQSNCLIILLYLFIRSAIAESELEYNPEHKSCSIYLKISLTRCSDRLVKKLSYNCNVYAIIWTTNPWTIFSNEAVAYNSDVK